MDFRQPLLSVLAAGPKRPADLDDELLGQVQFGCCFLGVLPEYGSALTDLVNSGEVKWWRDDEDIVWYAIAENSDKQK